MKYKVMLESVMICFVKSRGFSFGEPLVSHGYCAGGSCPESHTQVMSFLLLNKLNRGVKKKWNNIN